MTLLKSVLIGLTLAVMITPTWALSPSSVTFENVLGFSSNPSLAAVPSSDFFDRVSGVARFPIEATQNRFALRYSTYFKQTTNNLLALDWATQWSDYELRLLDRSYVHEEPGTTDQSFSRVGVAGSKSWYSSEKKWKYTPQVEMDRYSGGRFDFMPAFEFEVNPFTGDADRSFSLEFLPGLNVSTVGDFSKFYLSFSAMYDEILSDTTDFGASLDFTLSSYFSRTISSTVLVSGRGNSGGGTRIITDIESTFLLTPDIYWVKQLTRVLEFRAEVFANLQSSKSGTYDFKEFQMLGSLKLRL